MPIDYDDYPDNWKWLSKQTIKDAGDKCELCYAPNKTLIIRLNNSYTCPWRIAENGIEYEDMDEKLTKIVLTVHHINGNKNDCRKQNLIALCQKCHLRLDLLKHMDNRKRNKNKNNECLEL